MILSCQNDLTLRTDEDPPNAAQEPSKALTEGRRPLYRLRQNQPGTGTEAFILLSFIILLMLFDHCVYVLTLFCTHVLFEEDCLKPLKRHGDGTENDMLCY